MRVGRLICDKPDRCSFCGGIELNVNLDWISCYTCKAYGPSMPLDRSKSNDERINIAWELWTNRLK